MVKNLNQKEAQLQQDKYSLAALQKKWFKSKKQKERIIDLKSKILEKENAIQKTQEDINKLAPQGIKRARDYYIEAQIAKRNINPKKIKSKKAQSINPKLFSEKEYKEIIAAWNKNIKDLESQLDILSEEKKEFISEVSKMLGKIDNKTNDTNIIKILKEVYDMEQVYEKKFLLPIEGENGQPTKKLVRTEIISKEEYLAELNKQDKENKAKMAKLQTQIQNLNKQLESGTALLNVALNNWQKELKRVNVQATKLENDLVNQAKKQKKISQLVKLVI